MNKPAKIEQTVEQVLADMDKRTEANLRIWRSLSRTDPAHTKQFSRAGGFKGTAIKPIWVTQRLTEQFGPCGSGWGTERPEFQVVTAGDDILVYCTVTAWYLDEGKQHFLYGIGGDVVRGKNKYGPFSDDEAFKKAFTDALGNAFKFVGVGADVHMGLFDDSKYVREVQAEFHPPVKKDGDGSDAAAPRGEGDMSDSALRGSIKIMVHHLNGVGSLDEFTDYMEQPEAKATVEQCKRRFPHWWETGEGMPAEFKPLKTIISETRSGLLALETEGTR